MCLYEAFGPYKAFGLGFVFFPCGVQSYPSLFILEEGLLSLTLAQSYEKITYANMYSIAARVSGTFLSGTTLGAF